MKPVYKCLNAIFSGSCLTILGVIMIKLQLSLCSPSQQEPTWSYRWCVNSGAFKASCLYNRRFLYKH